jgi:hypothetical protein
LPAEIPETTPVIESTPASDRLPELQVPPATALERTVVEPTHTLPLPVIVAGAASTVTPRVVKQPVPKVYVITLVPADTPETTPVVPIVATDILLLAQVPPPGLVSVVVELPQRTAVPVIDNGTGLTVRTLVL